MSDRSVGRREGSASGARAPFRFAATVRTCVLLLAVLAAGLSLGACGSHTLKSATSETSAQTTDSESVSQDAASADSSTDDEQAIRDLIAAWGAAVSPAEVCALLTPAEQQREMQLLGTPSSCEAAQEKAQIGASATTYSRVDVYFAPGKPGTVGSDRATVQADDQTIYVRKTDGEWLVDTYPGQPQ